MRDRNPTESLDAEGIPGDLFEPPPGIDVETASEGLIAPRDHSIASGSDSAYPETAAENERPEPVAARAAREEPETGSPRRSRWREGSSVEVGEGGFLAPDPGADLEDVEDEEWAESDEGDGLRALSPEEAAVHIRSEDAADDVDPSVERAEYLAP